MIHHKLFTRTALMAVLAAIGFAAGGVTAAPDEARDSQSGSKTTPWVRSVRSGPWSAASTWKPARVPRTGDQVLVSPGTQVIYDVESAKVIRSILVAGVLRFADDRDTKLNVGLIRVQPGDPDEANAATGVEDVHDHQKPSGASQASLLVGAPDQPIPATVSAHIRLQPQTG